jgi:hypothetical protein
MKILGSSSSKGREIERRVGRDEDQEDREESDEEALKDREESIRTEGGSSQSISRLKYSSSNVAFLKGGA